MNGILLQSDPRSLPPFVRSPSIPPTQGCKDSPGSYFLDEEILYCRVKVTVLGLERPFQPTTRTR
jgi:hypothetical protein